MIDTNTTYHVLGLDLFDRFEIGVNGQIEKIIPAPWARDAFGLMLEAVHAYQQRPRQDLNPNLVSLFWFAQRVVVTT